MAGLLDVVSTSYDPGPGPSRENAWDALEECMTDPLASLPNGDVVAYDPGPGVLSLSLERGLDDPIREARDERGASLLYAPGPGVSLIFCFG